MRFWAKTLPDGIPGIDVYQHGQYVRAVAERLYAEYGWLPARIHGQQKFFEFLASVHDVGKIHLKFQAQCPAWLQQHGLEGYATTDRTSHPIISQNSLERFFAARHAPFDETHACWGVVVGAHHGSIVQSLTENTPGLYEAPSRGIDWEGERQALLLQCWQECGQPDPPIVDRQDGELWLTAGLLTLADWLGSDERFFPADPAMALNSPREVAAAAITDLGLGAFAIKPNLSFCDIFPAIREPNPMQIASCEMITGPGIYIIEAPMGMGKTEAALMAAYTLMAAGKARGLYFGLPTQATSNRIFLRVREFAQRISQNPQKVQLIHANSWLLDYDDLSCPETADAQQWFTSSRPETADAQQWFTSSRRALLAPIGVGTADQAMLAALCVKHFPLRRLGLAGKVVILDEVHSYDPYTRTVIERLCNVLEPLGCTVIILSATLSQKACSSLLRQKGACDTDQASGATPYPLLSALPNGVGTVNKHAVPPPEDTSIAVAFTPEGQAMRECIQAAASGAQVLWVCNTVAQAQQAYARLREMREDSHVPLGLLHARLPFFMRHEREELWMERFGKQGKRAEGAILVSTQIVEQSVDLDADLLVTELAPTDMLLQRIGRLWRHKREARPLAAPCVHILQEAVSLDELCSLGVKDIERALGPKAYVYDAYTLLQTLRLWSGFSRIALPSQIRPLIEATYSESDDLPPAWQELYKNLFANVAACSCLAFMNTNIWSLAGSDTETAPTRLIENPDHSFVLFRQENEEFFTLLDGSRIDSRGKKFDRETAKNLHNNVVRIPRYRFHDLNPGSFLKTYGIDGGWARIDGSTVHMHGLQGDRAPTWDTELGIVWPQKKEAQ